MNKIKAGYLKRLTKPLKTVGVIEENKAEGYVVTGGFVHTGNGDQPHVSFFRSQFKHFQLAKIKLRLIKFTNLYLFVAENILLGHTNKGPKLFTDCCDVSW